MITAVITKPKLFFDTIIAATAGIIRKEKSGITPLTRTAKLRLNQWVSRS